MLSLFRFLGQLSCAGETNLRAAIHSFTNLVSSSRFRGGRQRLFDPAGWRARLGRVDRKTLPVAGDPHCRSSKKRGRNLGAISRLVDVEGGRERKFFLDDDLVRRFQAELDSYFKEIEAVCASRHIDYLRTTTQVPFDEFVLQTLRQVSSVA